MMMGFRIIAKSTLLRILPPIFRFANRGYDLELTTRMGQHGLKDGELGRSPFPISSYPVMAVKGTHVAAL
jgi:hypothetical protein